MAEKIRQENQQKEREAMEAMKAQQDPAGQVRGQSLYNSPNFKMHRTLLAWL